MTHNCYSNDKLKYRVLASTFYMLINQLILQLHKQAVLK
jgi:hypothetical protein